MKLYKINSQILISNNGEHYSCKDVTIDEFINRDDLHQFVLNQLIDCERLTEEKATSLLQHHLQAPMGSQEVWASGVTYLRSRDARMEESKESGGATFYDKVYEADRPELFFKSLPHRVAGHMTDVFIRRDSSWNVPEPELALFINSKGKVQAYTIGNDMSSRSIEGENPLYLPQAKTYERSAALGPCLYIPKEPISMSTLISMNIKRKNEIVFEGEISLAMMKRSPDELVEYLYREMDFPVGCFLMTGTCLVPDNSFTLQPKDAVNISIENIGTLTNYVAYNKQSPMPE